MRLAKTIRPLPDLSQSEVVPPKMSSSSSTGDEIDVTKMALYKLGRAQATLTALSSKPTWSLEDTASFDHMHYDSFASLTHCALQLNLEPYSRILDIGSGFNATGRFLASRYDAIVTGVELQPEIHKLAETITSRNENPHVVHGVRSVNADILSLTPQLLGHDEEEKPPFDHVVSFLCILHLPASARRPLFQKVAQLLGVGGKLYVEDFYARHPGALTDEDLTKLRETNQCSFLPTREEFVSDVSKAGFEQVTFEDVSEHWLGIVQKRARDYAQADEKDEDLLKFYRTVAELFEVGNVRGVRLTATRR